jgi:hypothetical protein
MKRWVDILDDEDLAFLKRFLLASGSLKELAEAYGISYPTVRLRLDRLIDKVKVLDVLQPMSDFERSVRSLHAEGTIDLATLKKLLRLHQSELEKNHEGARGPAGAVDGDKREFGSG